MNVAANPSKPMDFRKRVEGALDPMVAELRNELLQYPTFWVLNHYLLKTHFARIDKSEMPDGYWLKWRYLWARATARRSARPAIWRVRSTGTWDSAGCGTSYRRWPDVRSRSIDRDGRRASPCGNG